MEETPHQRGDAAEFAVMSALAKQGYVVLIPVGNGYRYDLVAEQDGEFYRIQCKRGWWKNGSIVFNTASQHYHRNGEGRRNYRGDIDFFGVWSPDTEDTYLVPVEDVGTTSGTLRIDPPKNGQEKGIRWAETYALR